MLKNNIKNELQNILSGKSPVGDGNVIQTIANYLRRSQATSKLAQTEKLYKKEETEKLITLRGIILEDLHDENVLTQNGILYFIDTVFYINPEIFWAKG